MTTLRLRQAVLVAHDLDEASARIEGGLGLRDPYADPGVGQFGLRNLVYEAGSDFLEIVSPTREGTAAGRYLDRVGDGGYMAIFQVGGFAELAEVRARLPELGLQVVWEANLDDIATSHLHPRDVPGAIVSVDAAEPLGSWRWAGPRWIGGPPAQPYADGGISSITVAVKDPQRASGIWSALLGCELDPLPSGQTVRFVEGTGGIIDVGMRLGGTGEATVGSATVRATTQEDR